MVVKHRGFGAEAERQADEEGAAAARGVRNVDRPAQRADDFAGDGQTEAEVVLDAAGAVRAVKTLEYFLFFFVRDADAVINDGQNKSFRLFNGIEGQSHGNAAAGGRIADGIVQKNGDYLSEAFRIAEAGRQGGLRQRDRKGNIFFFCHRLKGFKGI